MDAYVAGAAGNAILAGYNRTCPERDTWVAKTNSQGSSQPRPPNLKKVKTGQTPQRWGAERPQAVGSGPGTKPRLPGGAGKPDPVTRNKTLRGREGVKRVRASPALRRWKDPLSALATVLKCIPREQAELLANIPKAENALPHRLGWSLWEGFFVGRPLTS